MTKKQIRTLIEQCASIIEFEYDGKYGNIDPCYSRNEGFLCLLYFDNYEIMTHSVDEAIKTPFIDGKSLNEIAELLEIY